MRRMKRNLTAYVEAECDVPFTRRSLNAVDAAIFAQLAYLDYSLVPDTLPQTLAAVAEAGLIPQMGRGIWMSDLNDRLVQALAVSVRFKDVTWRAVEHCADTARELRFAAITFILDRDEYLIAYRGTQAALVDWKEDFNMTYLQAVPSQELAADYLQRQVTAFPGKYYVAGHSKGGNLAVYAMMHNSLAVQGAVQLIYNFDGPGLKVSVPVNVQAKVRKFVPESTIIGLLLEPDAHYRIVQSNVSGISQHNLLTWRVQRRHFAPGSELRWSARYTQRAIDEWLRELDPEMRRDVLDSFYAVLAASDIDDLNALGQALPQTARTVVSQMRAADPTVRAQWQQALGDLMTAMRRAAVRSEGSATVVDRVRDRRRRLLEKMRR